MAFVPTYTAEDDLLSFINLRNEHELIARVCLGCDDETGAIYSVFVALTVDFTNPKGREISFDVIESLPDEEDNWCSDGLQTKRFLTGEHRKAALSCICSVVQTMVEQDDDIESLYMMTVETDLPPKALAKYDAISQAVGAMGFKAGRDSPFHGTHIWLMARNRAES